MKMEKDKRYISPGGWFSLSYPAAWSEFEDGEDSFLFYNPDVWTGNFRISAYRGEGAYADECLFRELKENPQASLLCRSLEKSYEKDPDRDIYMNAMLPSHLAEKAAAYLFCEQNMIGESLLVKLSYDLGLDSSYLEKTLMENRHPVSFSQGYLL